MHSFKYFSLINFKSLSLSTNLKVSNFIIPSSFFSLVCNLRKDLSFKQFYVFKLLSAKQVEDCEEAYTFLSFFLIQSFIFIQCILSYLRKKKYCDLSSQPKLL